MVRPLNLTILVAGVLLGGVLATSSGNRWVLVGDLDLVLAALAAALVGAGGNVYNDLRDVAIDRVNRPERALPSGRVTLGAARLLWIALTGAGVLVAALVSGAHGGVAAGVAGLLVLYSARLKGQPLVGNVLVAVLIGVALLFGAGAVGAWSEGAVGALFALLTTLARELVKDVEDLPGDAALGARTLPVVVGVPRTLRSVQSLLGVTVALTPLPYLLLGYEPLYLPVVLGAAALLLTALVRLQRPRGATLRSASRAIKGAMVVGIGALAVGAPL